MPVEKLDVFARETCDYLLPSIFFILDFKIGSFTINIKKKITNPDIYTHVHQAHLLICFVCRNVCFSLSQMKRKIDYSPKDENFIYYLIKTQLSFAYINLYIIFLYFV
jgi:hypothetical protein